MAIKTEFPEPRSALGCKGFSANLSYNHPLATRGVNSENWRGAGRIFLLFEKEVTKKDIYRNLG